ncbi:hypothetical protein QVD17_19077 [Tagetes erecta]|uniref:CCHC-type domain-containing protein n=1 Tax=Tagetes erecta TaxID=13708 RepID=A0AAD8NWZ4_TARER|nr:hypothetical protein QVD17_19077 [Tagetes erecta]
MDWIRGRAMENAKDNEIDLRLALGVGVGVANQHIEIRDAGANANADANSRSRIDTNAGRLSELVWSTQNGLSIKCGGCILSDGVGHTVENGGEVKCARFVDGKGKGKECVSIPAGSVIGTSEGDMGDGRGSAGRGVEEMAENDVIVKEAGDDSSGESCNSASNKKSKRGLEMQLISASKRLKKQSQDVRKHDSSFMNWISNMVKPSDQNDHPADEKTVKHEIFGFRSVFQSLYIQRLEETETKTQRESSKEIVLFDSQKSRGSNHNAFQKPSSTLLTKNVNSECKPIASAGCKKPVAVASLYETDALKCTTPMAMRSCFFCGKTGHESRDCLHTNENKNAFLQKNMKVSNLHQSGLTSGLLNKDKILRIPKEMFDTVRRLRLSRTDILKWMNSRSTVANLEGFFVRLRLSKWEEGVGEAGYYVACITDENPSKGCKQPIRVNIGSVQCLVECRYISNCDFLEDELVAWWRTSGRGLMAVEDLTSKLQEKIKLGLSLPETYF